MLITMAWVNPYADSSFTAIARSAFATASSHAPAR